MANFRRGPQQGPVHACLVAAQRCGFEWVEPRCLKISRRFEGMSLFPVDPDVHVPLLGGECGAFQHALREALRLSVLREIPQGA